MGSDAAAIPSVQGCHEQMADEPSRCRLEQPFLGQPRPAANRLPLGHPSAPKQFIQYLEEDNRPQVKMDVNFENGMGISVGRLREDTVYDWKFVGLSHNTVRGAAGGAVLCAETLKAKGYIQAK